MPFGLLSRLVLTEGTAKMIDGMSILAIIIVLILGYVMGRVYPQLGQMVGLP
jgi:hypothetical protein